MTTNKNEKPTQDKMIEWLNCFDKTPNNNGIPNAPKPKKAPNKLRLAPLSPVLISETTALVAPFKIPPHIPTIKMQTCKMKNEFANANPSKEGMTNKVVTMRSNLYP